jgi:hypothetical protein
LWRSGMFHKTQHISGNLPRPAQVQWESFRRGIEWLGEHGYQRSILHVEGRAWRRRLFTGARHETWVGSETRRPHWGGRGPAGCND